MDHLLNYAAHVLVGYGIRRTLFHVPFGFVVLLVGAAVLYLLRRTARRRGYRRSRR